MSLRTVARAAVALALAGSALTLVGPAPVLAAGTCEQSVPVVPVDKTIQNGSTNRLIVDMPEDGAPVTRVAMALDVQHSNLSDLSVTLRWHDDADVASSPVATLIAQGTLSGANLTGTVLDDAASTSITSGAAAAPYGGQFRPEQPLSGVTGHVGGMYELIVTDNTLADGDGGGTLDDWTLAVTYASCDLDADAVEDHADACPGTAGDPTTGCPVPVEQVTASYRRGKFRGIVRSSVAACASARPVKVWKVRPGPDRLVATGTSRSDGSYRLVRTRHLGRYYTTVPGVLLPGVADCPSVRSPILRIR